MLVALTLLACTPPLTPLEAGPVLDRPEADPIPLGPALDDPRLADVSVFAADGLSTGRPDAGSYGIGNGRVFALVGLDRPWSTMTNAMGPIYQRDGGFFGDSAPSLWRGGEAVVPTRERAQRPRGSALVRTAAETDDLLWTTLDGAAPDDAVLVRHLAVHNQGDAPAGGLTLRLSLARAADEAPEDDGEGLVQRRGDRKMRLRCPGAALEEGGLALEVPTLEPGGWWEVDCEAAFADADAPFPALDDPAGALLESLEATAAWLADAAALDAPEPAAADLVEGMLITVYTQTDASGVVSPMNRYTGGWLRDGEGPVRLLLAVGLFEEARAILDGTYAALVRRGAIANSFSLELAAGGVEAPADPEDFWGGVPFMPGREASEAPSYPVLLHALAHAHDGRGLPDDGRLAFLQACLDRQEVSDDGTLPFSGDETYRFAMLGTLGAEPEALGWSTQAMMLLLAASEALEDLGGRRPEAAGRVSAALEAAAWDPDGGFYSPLLAYDTLERWPRPYEDVNTTPGWWPVPLVHPDRARRNVAATAEALMREDGTLLSPGLDGGEGYGFTGMVPGQWLAALAAVDDPRVDLAFAALGRVASVSGHFEEGHGADNRPIALVHRADGTGDDAPARYRPWEGGDSVSALLTALVGYRPDAAGDALRLSPHLPAGWPTAAVRGLRLGDERFDVALEGFVEGTRVTLVRDGGARPWTLTLALHGRQVVEEVAPGAEVVLFVPR